jgi:hypothetical protein
MSVILYINDKRFNCINNEEALALVAKEEEGCDYDLFENEIQFQEFCLFTDLEKEALTGDQAAISILALEKLKESLLADVVNAELNQGQDSESYRKAKAILFGVSTSISEAIRKFKREES